MEPQITADITNYVSYANANAASMPLVDPEIASDPAIFPPAEVHGEAVPDGGLRGADGPRPGSGPR